MRRIEGKKLVLTPRGWSVALLAAIVVTTACASAPQPRETPPPPLPGKLTNQQLAASWANDRAERERVAREAEAQRQEELRAAQAAESIRVAVPDLPPELEGQPEPEQATEDEADEAPVVRARADAPRRLTDAQIRRLLIQDSIDSYSGNCPCPYNSASNGSSCGRRSAYSRAGGEEPLCYPGDVTKKLVDEYRAAQEAAQ
jgi:hypothetical protein